MKDILVALELKPSDKNLLKYALSLAKVYQAKVWIIHIAAPEPDFVGYEVGPIYIREQRADELRKEHREIQTHMDQFTSEGVDCDALLIAGPTLETLEKEVKKLKVELLIMGNHRRGFLYDTFIGSTTTQMVKSLNIPLFLVPIDA